VVSDSPQAETISEKTCGQPSDQSGRKPDSPAQETNQSDRELDSTDDPEQSAKFETDDRITFQENPCVTEAA
jgi:hypothetical protein